MSMELNLCVNALRLIAHGVKVSDWESARLVACDALEAIDTASTRPQIDLDELSLAFENYDSQLDTFGYTIATQHLIQWFYERGVDLTMPLADRKPKRKRLKD